MSHYSQMRTSDDRTRISALALATSGMLCGVWSSLALSQSSVSTIKSFAWGVSKAAGESDAVATTYTGVTAAAREVTYTAKAAAVALGSSACGDDCELVATSSVPTALEGECAEHSAHMAATLCFGVALSALAVAAMYKVGCNLTRASMASSAAAAAALGYAVTTFYSHCAADASELGLGWHLAAVAAICHIGSVALHMVVPQSVDFQYFDAERKFAQPPMVRPSSYVNAMSAPVEETDPLSALGMPAGRQGVVCMSAATARREAIAQSGRRAREAARRLRIGLQRRQKCEEGRMRLRIFRSNNHMYAQIIDDTKHHTLVSASTTESAVKEQLESSEAGPLTANKDAAFLVGKLVAERAKAAGVDKVFFDRGDFKYHGRVAAVADGAREGGLDF